MDNDIMLRLVRQLEFKTKRNQLNWVPSGVDAYRIALGDGTVETIYYATPYIDPEGEIGPDYMLRFMNERNEVIGILAAYEKSDSCYEQLESIYIHARSNYLKIDSTFRSMLDALDS